MAEKIKVFFAELESIWGALPGYLKAAIYASLTAIIVQAVDDHSVDWWLVLKLVVTNLGLYQVPRTINSGVRKL